VSEYLAPLTARELAAVLLYVNTDLNCVQIGARLGISKQAVECRLTRAAEKLQVQRGGLREALLACELAAAG
jgi:DNA-directed RNA polymerase specialized sigma24 family protein